MHVLFDGRMINNTGIGRIVQNFSKFLFSTKDIAVTFLLNDVYNTSCFDNPNVKFKKLDVAIPIYSLSEQLLLPFEISKLKPDLIHFPHFNLPILESHPFIVTINDLIYYLFPEACPSKLKHFCARYMISRATQKAKKIITISQYSKYDLLRHLKISEKKITVIYPGVDNDIYHPVEDEKMLEKCRSKYGINKKFIFYTGNHEPRKNLIPLIKAFSQLKNIDDYQLVIGGKIDPRRKDLYKFSEELVLKNNLIFTNFIDENDLVLLYNMAEAFVFPSLYEGFGLPPLEAMACGTPVICSNTSSLPEVVGDAALLFNPTDTQEIKQTIEDVLENNDLRNNLIEKGKNRASSFKWSEAVKNFIQLYKENQI